MRRLIFNKVMFMFRNFKLLFLPLDGGGEVGVMEKVNHPPLAPPIKGGVYLVTESLIQYR